MLRLLLLTLLGCLISACTSSTRVEDPAEFFGLRAHTAYKMTVEEKVEPEDPCAAILRLECEKTLLQYKLDQCEKPDPQVSSFTIPQPDLEINVTRACK